MKKSKIFLLLFLSVILISCKKEVLLESISIKENSMQTEFFRGDIYNFDNTILILEYSDDSKKEIKANTQGVEITGFDTATEGKKEVVFTYGEKQVKQEISVKKLKVTKLEISEYFSKEYIKDTDQIRVNTNKVVLNYNNGKTEIIDLTNENIEVLNFDNTNLGIITVAIYLKLIIIKKPINNFLLIG